MFIMTFNIRKYNQDDKLGVKNCIVELKEYESSFDPDYLTDEESINNLLEDIEKGEILVAESNNEILGFVSFNITNKNEDLIVKNIPTLYISDLVVLSQYRGNGIGAELLKSAEEFAKERGIKYIKLIVFSENSAAIKLYEKAGFGDYEATLLKKIAED